MQRVNLSANYPSLSGHVVIVTGGASGIRRAIVEDCVALLDVQDAAAELLIEGIVESGRQGSAFYHIYLETLSLISNLPLASKRTCIA